MTEKNNMIWSSSSAPTDADLLKFITDHPEECLQYRNPDGSIDLDGVRIEMEKSRRSIVLDNYIDRIGKLNGKTDKRYYIKLKNPNKKDGRQTLKAPTKEGLLEKIYEWHVTHVEHGHDYVPKEEVTLALLFSEFLEHKRATTWSPSTETKNISIWNNHYEGTDIINVPLQEIRLKHLQEWAYGLIREHDLTKKEFGNVCTWMKQMMEYAEQEEIIDKNVYPLLKITNQNVFRQIETKPDENKVLTSEQEIALYRECWRRYTSKYYPTHCLLPLAIIMLFQTGMRPSEVCSLRYDDIDSDEIVVRRYYSDKGDMVMENRTKAGHGPRRIILTSLAKELVHAAREYQLASNLNSNGYIFMTNDNFQSFYGRMRKTFPGLCDSAGIPRNTPYSGRRTFVSSLIDARVNIRTIQNFVGHKDARTTFNNYCYDRTEKAERARQLENARIPFSMDSVLPESVPTVPNFQEKSKPRDR